MWWHYTSKGKNTERRKSACNKATKRNEMKEQNQQWWWILLTLSNFHMSAIIFEQYDYDVYFLEDKADHACTHRPLEAETESHCHSDVWGHFLKKNMIFVYLGHKMTTNNKVGILTQLEKGFCCKPSLSLYNWDPSSPWTRHGSTT